MKISLDSLRYFTLGALILIPINIELFDTQVFYIQTLVIISLAFYLLLFKNRGIYRVGKLTSLETIFFLYLAWIVFSFLLNLIFSMDDFDVQARRLFSIAIAISLMSGFFVGQALPNIENKTDTLVKGVLFTYLFVIFYFVIFFLTQARLDLYFIRDEIGQRLPFVIAFVVSLAAAYFFLGKLRNLYYFTIMASGIFTVAFSLTRAAYIQIAFSFVIIFLREIRKYFFEGLIVISLFVAAGFIIPKVFSDTFAVQQVTSRVELIFDYQKQSKQDASGSFRLRIWTFLGKKLLEDPVRIVIGYGQLGPTQITRDFKLPNGHSGTSSAHNQYLDMIIREGVVGLGLFLALCAKALSLGFSRSRVGDSKGLFMLANSIGLVGVLFYGFFHETFRYPLFGFYFWLYLGILSKITKEETSASQ